MRIQGYRATGVYGRPRLDASADGPNSFTNNVHWQLVYSGFSLAWETVLCMCVGFSFSCELHLSAGSRLQLNM